MHAHCDTAPARSHNVGLYFCFGAVLVFCFYLSLLVFLYLLLYLLYCIFYFVCCTVSSTLFVLQLLCTFIAHISQYIPSNVKKQFSCTFKNRISCPTLYKNKIFPILTCLITSSRRPCNAAAAASCFLYDYPFNYIATLHLLHVYACLPQPDCLKLPSLPRLVQTVNSTARTRLR